jgi:hypothetical protein
MIGSLIFLYSKRLFLLFWNLVEGRFEKMKAVLCLVICEVTVCKGVYFPACVGINIYNNNLVAHQSVFLDALNLSGYVSEKSRCKYLDFPIYSSWHQ